MSAHMPNRWHRQSAFLARRFFLATVIQAAGCLMISAILIGLHGPVTQAARIELPAAFQFGTAALAAGSWFLHQAVVLVRLEKQEQFRRSLLLALGFAMLFVGVQSYGLWAFATGVVGYHRTQTNVHGFVFMFAALHAMHFLLAQSVLLWITLNAFMDRYDHEYNWGVVFAAWCWHALGIVWLAILCVFAIVT